MDCSFANLSCLFLHSCTDKLRSHKMLPLFIHFCNRTVLTSFNYFLFPIAGLTEYLDYRKENAAI